MKRMLTAIAATMLVAATALPAVAEKNIEDSYLIDDLTGTDFAREVAEAAAERIGQPTSNALPNYQFIDHGTFWEVNAQDPGLFQSEYLDNTLYDEMFDAINEWYSSVGYDPDFVVLYKAWDPASYGAFYAPLANDTMGIGYKNQGGPETFDQTGSLKLSGLIWMSALSQYNFGNSSRIVLNAFWGQELGHRWGSFVRFDDNGFQSSALLGRDQAHWSYWMDTDWSCMEGNDWNDNGDGSFTTNNTAFAGRPSYMPLDLYLMGLVPPTAVPEMWYIENPTGSGRNATSPPEMPFGQGAAITVNGTKRTLTVDQILSAEGQRNPWWLNERRTYKVAMFVLSRNGQQLNSTEISRAGNYADWMAADFGYNTRYLANIDLSTTSANPPQPPKPVISADDTVKEDKAMTLDASGSTDPSGSELAYVWEFGDGTADFTSGPVVEKTWDKDGTYTVTLLAVNRGGTSAYTQQEIKVTAAKDDKGLMGCNCAISSPERKLPATGLLIGLLGLMMATVLIRRPHA